MSTAHGSWRLARGRGDLRVAATTPEPWRRGVVVATPRYVATTTPSRRPALESRDYGVVINVARPAATLESGDYALTVVRLHVPSEMLVTNLLLEVSGRV